MMGLGFLDIRILYVCFVDRFWSFCTFSFGRCVICSSSIYGFSLPLWYLQTILIIAGPGSVCEKWNISVVICDHNDQPSHRGDRKTFEVMTST
jgi:hypothetical protein